MQRFLYVVSKGSQYFSGLYPDKIQRAGPDFSGRQYCVPKSGFCQLYFRWPGRVTQDEVGLVLILHLH